MAATRSGSLYRLIRLLRAATASPAAAAPKALIAAQYCQADGPLPPCPAPVFGIVMIGATSAEGVSVATISGNGVAVGLAVGGAEVGASVTVGSGVSVGCVRLW